MAIELLDIPSWQKGDHDTIKIDSWTLGPPVVLVRAVKGFKRDLRIEHKKGAGADGGNLRLKGLELARGSVEVVVWTEEGERLMREMRELLMPEKAPNLRDARLVQHPDLQDLGITRCVVQSMEPHPPEGGMRLWTISLWEQRQGSTKASTKPKETAAPPPVVSLPGSVPQTRNLPDINRPSARVSVK